MESRVNQFNIITVGEHQLLIDAQWNTEPKKKGILFSLSLRNMAKESGRHHAVKFSPGQSSALQYTLANLGDTSKAIYAGDVIVAKSAKDWVSANADALIVFIKTLPPRSEHVYNSYWISATSIGGSILSGSRQIVDGESELVDAINLLCLTYSTIQAVSLDSDFPLSSFFSENAEKLSSIGDVQHSTISDSRFEAAINLCSNDAQFRKVFNPSSIQPQKVWTFTAVAITLALALSGRSYVQQSESAAYFNDTSAAAKLASQKISYDKKMNELKVSTKKWDDRSFRKVTLDQFTGDLERNLYSPMDIVAVLNEVNQVLPIFAAQWRLTKLTYENNRFFCRYERIEGGKGVYFSLDQYLSLLQTPSFKIKPHELTKEGTVRTFEITPNIRLHRAESLAEMSEQLRRESKSDTQLSRQLKKMSDVIGDISSLRDQFNAMNFSSRWVFNDGEELLTQARAAEKELADAESALRLIQNEREKIKPLVLSDGLIIGNVMDFVSMMQVDSFFDWDYPALVRYYPDAKELNDRNKDAVKSKKMQDKKGKEPLDDDDTAKKRKKTKTSKGKDAGVVYGPAIESYSVKITTQASSDKEKTRSYGMADMLQLGMLINKPFVNVDLVEYDKLSEQWGMNIHFHRKTSEYTNRIVGVQEKSPAR